jgi:hypothetical protein
MVYFATQVEEIIKEKAMRKGAERMKRHVATLLLSHTLGRDCRNVMIFTVFL